MPVAGRWDAAEKMWALLDPMGRDWSRIGYLPGLAEQCRLEFMLFPQGRLAEKVIATAELLARSGLNREAIRRLHRLRGEWRIGRGEYGIAAGNLDDAIQMAREAGFSDYVSETLLALARFHLKQLPAGREEAQRLSAVRNPAHLPLAELWRALGETDQATKHAKAAYQHAWADGEPHVRRHDLERAKALLRQLGEDIPELPAYVSSKYPKEPWEDEIAAGIEELRKSAEPET